jgi:signal transduction histidine kinase
VPLPVGGRLLGAVWLAPAGEAGDFLKADGVLLQQVGALIGLALDRAQHEAQAASPELQPAAGQARSEALATLSHELRTPLAAIKGYATALLLDEVEWTPEEQREFLTLIDRECDTVQVMISEVLDSALIDAGHLGLAPEPVRLPLLAREVADETQRQTAVHRLVVDFPGDFPLLMADPRRLRQVLRNVLDNAVKYSPEGGLIVMRGEVRQADVVISVADQGVGIAPEDLIPLFDKYFRVQRAAGEYVPGTGLGLPITRAIVEAHGGRIWAESKLGQGTIFHFSLPRGEPALAEGPEP